MKTIAVYHNKGGVGKTTLTVNLAASFSRKGYRVLLIDLDSQANSTYATGLIKFHDELQDDIKENYVYHVIRERNAYFIPDVVKQSKFTDPPFDVVPSHIDLMQHEKELIEIAPARTRLFSKLQRDAGAYDIVIIDTPPSLNIYSQIALIAADYLLIPSDLKPFANEGLRNIQNFIAETNEFREQIGQDSLQILGIVPSKIATAHRFVEFVLPRMEETVRGRYGFPVLKSRIFERRDVSAAIERTLEVGEIDIPDPQSIFDYKPDSQAAEEFEALTQEVMQLAGI
ncbi:ParA family protein [Nodosilinea sp. AN01ver1]|uniref:ParA family protein n=1 Tax=Nodosilinea sp. AN01ver1 TaxID=3423362 RepID=UPI003D32421C